MAPSTARPMSASAKTTWGPLPPSSSITCLPAARFATDAPVSVEPTKPTPSTSGWPATSSPTSAPGPVTRLTAPAGKSASTMHSISATEITLVEEAGHRRASLVGGLDRALGVGAGALGDLGDDLAGRRAVGVKELAALGLDPPAFNEHLPD